jgi:hypothetical protein
VANTEQAVAVEEGSEEGKNIGEEGVTVEPTVGVVATSAAEQVPVEVAGVDHKAEAAGVVQGRGEEVVTETAHNAS